MKYYDKLMMIVAVIVIAASVGFYFYSMPNLGQKEAQISAKLAQKAQAKDWEAVKVPEWKEAMPEWAEVRPQDDEGLWYFQVFTPPQIWIDKDGNFSTESPYQKVKQRKIFSLSYGGISNEAYSIKYMGTQGSTILLQNTKTGVMLEAIVNEPVYLIETSEDNLTGQKVDTGLVVKSIETTSEKNDMGIYEDKVSLVISDKNLGKDVPVYSYQQTYLEDQRRLKLKDKDGSVWIVKEIGQEKAGSGVNYKILALDFDKGEAVVEMTPSDPELVKQVMKLSENGIEAVEIEKK